jgi:MoxR-like ATPase
MLPPPSSPLLEVMQEHQVTIGADVPRPRALLVLATQNPIESDLAPIRCLRLSRPLMFKVLVDYPSYDDELVVVQRVTGRHRLRTVLTPSCCSTCSARSKACTSTHA